MHVIQSNNAAVAPNVKAWRAEHSQWMEHSTPETMFDSHHWSGMKDDYGSILMAIHLNTGDAVLMEMKGRAAINSDHSCGVLPPSMSLSACRFQSS